MPGVGVVAVLAPRWLTGGFTARGGEGDPLAGRPEVLG